VQAITYGAYSESSIGSLAEEISSYVDLNFISFKVEIVKSCTSDGSAGVFLCEGGGAILKLRP
jgi:hypothetical protein